MFFKNKTCEECGHIFNKKRGKYVSHRYNIMCPREPSPRSPWTTGWHCEECTPEYDYVKSLSYTHHAQMKVQPDLVIVEREVIK